MAVDMSFYGLALETALGKMIAALASNCFPHTRHSGCPTIMLILVLGVQSRHLVDRILDEAVWFGYPDLADVFVGREATEGLESACEVVGCHEVRQMGAQLVVVIVVETLDRRVFDGAVHALHLTAPRENSPPDCFLILVAPRMVWLRKAMFDTVGLTDHVEAHWP